MRKEKVVTINDRGRDLTFKIREMPATKAERWLTRALLLLGGGKDLNAILEGAQSEQLGAVLSMLCTGLEYEKAEPLLNELLACCSRIDAGIEQHCTPESVDGYIEDFRTLFRLKWEALSLMYDFFPAENPSNSQGSEAEAVEQKQGSKQGVKPIRMSRGSSER